MTEVITEVSETVNWIMSKWINSNHQFVDFLGDIHYCMEVHWLNCGGMLCKSETKLFLELREKPLLQLYNHYWMWNFAFCINHLIHEWIHEWMKFNEMFDKISVQEEDSIVGPKDVIKQYDTLPSTEDGNT